MKQYILKYTERKAHAVRIWVEDGEDLDARVALKLANWHPDQIEDIRTEEVIGAVAKETRPPKADPVEARKAALSSGGA